MPIIDRCFADLLQHFAVAFEFLALYLNISDLFIHQADRGLAFRRSVAGVPDRRLTARAMWSSNHPPPAT